MHRIYIAYMPYGLLLQVSHVPWSANLSVRMLATHRRVMHKRLNRSRRRLGGRVVVGAGLCTVTLTTCYNYSAIDLALVTGI